MTVKGRRGGGLEKDDSKKRWASSSILLLQSKYSIPQFYLILPDSIATHHHCCHKLNHLKIDWMKILDFAHTFNAHKKHKDDRNADDVFFVNKSFS